MKLKTVGSNLILEMFKEVEGPFKEIGTQTMLYRMNPTLYKQYIKEFSVSCLIDNPGQGDLSECSKHVLEFVSKVNKKDISSLLKKTKDNVLETLLSSNAQSIKNRQRKNSTDFEISVNGMVLKVDSFKMREFLISPNYWPSFAMA